MSIFFFLSSSSNSLTGKGENGKGGKQKRGKTGKGERRKTKKAENGKEGICHFGPVCNVHVLVIFHVRGLKKVAKAKLQKVFLIFNCQRLQYFS
jgi:hypothetical protein